MTIRISTFLLNLIVIYHLPAPTQQSTRENRGAHGTKPFCYEEAECGPKSETWGGICQTGKHQSPIDLPHNEVTIAQAKKVGHPLTFLGYKSSNFYIRNNGHSIQVSFNPEMDSYKKNMSLMSGYGLEDRYIFAQAHFHWGKNIEVGGSEHTVNGVHYPIELHFVNYDAKYKDFAEAAATTDDPDALAVLAMFLNPIKDSPESARATTFSLIAENAPPAYQSEPTFVDKPLNLTQFLPKSGDTIYRYDGSLTTPGCTENVQWSVIPEPIPVRIGDYLSFHKLRDHEGDEMRENFRPVQPLFDRKIEIFHRL